MDQPAGERADDTALAGELAGGSREAMTELFDRYVDPVHAHCLRLTGDHAEAEDACATAFLEVWRGRDRVVLHDDSVLPWLYGVATNVCRNATRRRRRQHRLTGRLAGHVEVARGATPDHAGEVVDRVDADRRLREVADAVAGLPPHERDVVALVAWSELTYAEAAVALGVPVGTVRSRLSRARARLTAEPTTRSARGVR